MGVLLESFFFGPGRVAGVPSPLDGDPTIPFWWDHLASQAQEFATAGFTAIWLPPPLKGSSGSFSSGYDAFDDYDLGSKEQKGTIPTRYGGREALQRCAAMMRAHRVDLYVDLVENQRDGDDGHFNFAYVNALGEAATGRFAKGPGDFHPNVPQDPGVFSDQFQFGRDLAPINGTPKNHCLNGLIDAASWLTRALDLQGFRLDNAKGVSTEFVSILLRHGVLADKFAVAEFADGNVQLIENWANAVGHRSAAFDFPLRFALQNMCNNPGGFDMSTLDHAGLAGRDPAGAVTFVENHDTDQGGVGGPIVQNKLLAYAYILTSEGYPCVFYRDYSTDKNCFGLKPEIDTLILIHETLAEGTTQQRWKDRGLFAYERMGGGHLLVALNNGGTSRTIHVQTGFPAHSELHDFTHQMGPITVDGSSQVTLSVPANIGGRGYVCYALRKTAALPRRTPLATTQFYEGARDLDIQPATDSRSTQVCRIYARKGSSIDAHLTPEADHWSPATTITLVVKDLTGLTLATHAFGRAGGSVTVNVAVSGFHVVSVQTADSAAGHEETAFIIRLMYTAPETMPADKKED